MIINNIYCDFEGRPIDKGTLEDKITQVGQTVEDIRCLYYSMENMDEDQIMNALLGLEIFAKMRTDELWECFKQVNHNEGQHKENIQIRFP